MNEKIKAITARAIKERNREGLITDEDKMIALLERFAELIVLECAKVLIDSHPPGDCLPIEEVVGCITEHFSIK